jgi:Zn-dependent M28 family amino/carboxypeptidase
MKRLIVACFLAGILTSNALGDSLYADTTALRSHVSYLCDLEPPRSIDHISSLSDAVLYIEKELRLSSSRIELQDYPVEEGMVRNVIASFGPETGPRIVVGAHYDVAGDKPGADDNASGISGLLELARLLSEYPGELEKRIDLVAYTLEEPPFYGTEKMGSFIHAQSLYNQKVGIDYMISLEMIGYYSDSAGTQSFPISLMKYFYPKSGNFIALVSNFKSRGVCADFREKMNKGCEINIEKLSAPSFVTGVDFSDHRNYWHFGYKAFMITDTAFLRNLHYHEKSDTPETLNYLKMADVIDGVFCALTHKK